MAEISLIQDRDIGLSCEPCNPEPYCPTLHYSGKEELDIPESGTMKVRFRLKRETCTNEKTGEKRYEYDIEISSILSAKADDSEKQPYSRDTGAEDALDKLMEAREKE